MPPPSGRSSRATLYSDNLPEKTKMLADYGILAVEMEPASSIRAAKHQSRRSPC
ncbi:MAG: hypothetical protein ACLVL7_01385 [Anaerotruncus massiliensis (ex Togo et al. 2019)]